MIFMRHIEEIFYEKAFRYRLKNPYPTALDIMEIVQNFGIVKERMNEFITDGPRKTIKLIFDLIDRIDDKSRIVTRFNIDGEANEIGELNMFITSSVRVDMENPEGVFSETYAEFYIENILEDMKKNTKERIKRLVKIINERVKRSK